MCDKPAASDIGEALTMNEAAKKSGRIYGMVFHQRLYPKYMKIKSMIDAGELGELRRVNLINSRYLKNIILSSFWQCEVVLQVKAAAHLLTRDSIFLICSSIFLVCRRECLHLYHLANIMILQ